MAAPPLGLTSRVADLTSPAVAHPCSRPMRLRPCLLPSKRRSGVVRMGAVVGGGQEGGEDEEVRQAKEQAAARRRWETLIREQKIKTLTPREAGYTFKLTDKALLDVRPSNERQKAWVKGSTWIPVFDVDTSADLGGLAQKVTNFVMGGWWSGSSTMSFNKNFVQQVGEKFSKDADIILVCQKGLRILSGKAHSLSSLLVLAAFLNFLVGRISNVHRQRRKDWATGCSSQVAWLEQSCWWMLYFLALKGLALYFKNCSLVDAWVAAKSSLWH